MELFFTKVFVALGFVFILLFLVSLVLFVKNKSNYAQLVENYLDAGLLMPSYDKFLARMGFLGSFPVAWFFRKILERKKIKIAAGEYLPEASYAFLQQQPTERVGWVRKYTTLYFSLFPIFIVLVVLSFWI